MSMNKQLVLQFSLSERTDFDALLSLENVLQIILGRDHSVDGHDLGSSEMNLFVLTNDPVCAFNLIAPSIPAEHKEILKAAYRCLSEDKYHWIYPEQSVDKFTIA